ncbi:hypothetical protein [Prevotella pectinovora]|uniref:hypothetical protein n=1 Tax=Prevotella pectinovora TaxID=1602169 RepID=UPI00307A5407
MMQVTPLVKTGMQVTPLVKTGIQVTPLVKTGMLVGSCFRQRESVQIALYGEELLNWYKVRCFFVKLEAIDRIFIYAEHIFHAEHIHYVDDRRCMSSNLWFGIKTKACTSCFCQADAGRTVILSEIVMNKW